MTQRTPIITCLMCPSVETAATCGRCHRSLCIEHMPMPGARCFECELEYQERKSEVRQWSWFLVGFIAIWIVYAFAVGPVTDKYPGFQGGPMRAFSTGVASIDLAVFAVFASVTAGKTALWARFRALRGAFLGETEAL